MTRWKKDFYAKTLLMLGLAGAVMGAAHAGYDVDDIPDSDFQATTESAEVRERHAQLLIRTLSENFTEVRNLAAQQARFRQMGDAESQEIARMYGRWIREHKAAVPGLAYLIRKHDGDPHQATELEPPVLGTKHEMLMATHAAHQQAVRTSQIRFGETSDWDIRWAMNKRADLARKHMAEMARHHRM